MSNARQTTPAPSADGLRLDALRLIRSRRVGPATFHRLVAEYGSPAAAIDALPAIAAAAGVTDYAPCHRARAQNELLAGLRSGARLLCCFDAEYPQSLREIADAPPVIWVKGDLSQLSAIKVAVIGARNASSLGMRMAKTLALGLGEAGAVTVAGLARGIDSVVHENSRDTGTIAVMAGGIDVIYPSENANLARQICDRGVLLSEQPPGTSPVAHHFPARNRIISALGLGVVVVEAAERSGSLITARNALDQGREVLAVPGHPLDPRASGCNNLIRDGATLVRSTEDVVSALGLPTQDRLKRETSAQQTAPFSAPATVVDAPEDIGQRIINHLNLSPSDENALLRELGLPPHQAASALLSLELSGKVQRMAGGLIQRV
ncbi:DNA-processing protein DprA [Paracoccus sp. (in: a-proteobacteria)]|uniref:DNA-processing protein DprA n=1 Tax=Paracoccus sp. TaxID=267 RepID=UPI00289A0E13|nr:DNA-processing protein DprA [Paracoccus sp. (in: a-proteobacteria)]